MDPNSFGTCQTILVMTSRTIETIPLDDFIAAASNESETDDAVIELAMAAKVFQQEIKRIAAKYPATPPPAPTTEKGPRP